MKINKNMKNNNKKGFTFAEIFISLIVLMILSGLCINVFKNATNNKKLSFYAYATISNLMKGNIAAMESQDGSGSVEHTDVSNNSKTYDWLCLQMADAFTLKGTADCEKSTTNTDAKVNLQLANGVTIQGLATNWITPFDGADYKYKNIVMDIDSPSKGMNKIWADRIPLRLYSGGSFEGIVQVVSCGNKDYTYNGTTKVTPKTAHPFCKNNTTVVNKDFLTDDTIVTYNVYRAESTEENAKASMVASSLSSLASDCAATGEEGLYPKKLCQEKGFTILEKCYTSSNCELCNTYSGICKDEDKNVVNKSACDTKRATTNPNDISCFALIKKPSMGIGVILGTIMGDALDY